MFSPTLTLALGLLLFSPRLLRLRLADVTGLKLDSAAALRSFALMLLVLPVYLFSVASLADKELDKVPTGILAAVLTADYILQWVLFPVLLAGLVRLAGLPQAAFPSFVVVTNSLAALSAFLSLPLLVLYRLGAMDENAFFLVLILLFSGISIILSRWATLLFRGGFGFGVSVFLLGSFSSQSISLLTTELLKRHMEN